MNKNIRLMLLLFAIAFAMLGVAYAFVPLYRVFCQAFGIPLPSVVVDERLATPKPSAISEREITVRFLAQHNKTMPVTLRPVTYSMKVRLGEPALTAYRATNPTTDARDGVAVHMLYSMGGVDGVDLNRYIDLQQCFCFEEQHYPANKTVNLPLSFIVTPDLPEDIHTISFNYTLFPSEQAPEGSIR